MALSYGFCLGAAETRYDSRQFSEAFHRLAGGVCGYGDRFALTLDGFTATLAPGFALAGGRWFKSDEPYGLTLPPSGNYADRDDAIVVRADYGARRVAMEVLTGIDPAAIRADPAVIRNENGYGMVLYFVHVRRGATVLDPEDVDDVRGDGSLCGYVKRLDAVSADALYIYQFLTSGIDQEVARLVGLSNRLVRKADNAMADMDAAIQAVLPTGVGDVTESKFRPAPAAAWLLCDGGDVPEGYPALSAMLGGTLPAVTPRDRRFQAYIYGGMPV